MTKVNSQLQFLKASQQQDMDGWPGYWPGLPRCTTRPTASAPFSGSPATRQNT